LEMERVIVSLVLGNGADSVSVKNRGRGDAPPCCGGLKQEGQRVFIKKVPCPRRLTLLDGVRAVLPSERLNIH
jgi:hypothetical protein